jgi:hypothetical protein
MPRSRLIIAVCVILATIAIASILTFSLFSPKLVGNGKNLQIEWQQFLPGITGREIIQTSDGGYLALGTTADISNSDPREATFVNEQPILVKTDDLGNVQWQKTFQQVLGLTPTLSNIAQTKDGGYAVVGGITNNTVYDNPFSRFCLIKLDDKGNVNWTQTYDGGSDASNDVLNTVLETNDGYTLFGTWSRYWDYHGLRNGYLIKTDEAGNAYFSKGVDTGPASSFVQISDGYIFFSTQNAIGGGSKFLLVKTDFNGTKLWSSAYKEVYATSAYARTGLATNDGGYLLGGSLVSPDQGWLVKTDAHGNMLWNKTYSETTTMNSVEQTQDGGFVISGGITYINPSDNGKSSGLAWIAKTDNLGNVVNHITIGQNATFHYTDPNSLILTNDGKYVCVGTWDRTIQASNSQRFWITKIIS